MTTKIQREGLEPLINEGADREVSELQDIYRKQLKYDEIQTFRDLSKKQILEKLSELRRRAELFTNSQNCSQEFQLITVSWVGYQLSTLSHPNLKESFDYDELIYP